MYTEKIYVRFYPDLCEQRFSTLQRLVKQCAANLFCCSLRWSVRFLYWRLSQSTGSVTWPALSCMLLGSCNFLSNRPHMHHMHKQSVIGSLSHNILQTFEQHILTLLAQTFGGRLRLISFHSKSSLLAHTSLPDHSVDVTQLLKKSQEELINYS